MKKKIKKYKFGAKLEENPGIETGINSAIGALDGLSSMIPQDNLGQGAQKGIDIGKGIAKPLDMVIPGLGTGLGFLAEGIGGLVSHIKGNKKDPRNNKTLDTTMNNITTNPYGTQFKMGGKFYQLGGTKVSEFDAPTHNQGGMNIDENMNPTDMNSKGEIEKKEVGVGNYIFSDFLKDSDGKTFAEKAKKITRKYKGREDSISLSSMDKELSALSKINESLKQTQESTKFKEGGFMLKKDSNQEEILPGDFLSTNSDSILTDLIGEVPTVTAKRITPQTFNDSKGKMIATKFMNSLDANPFSKGPEVDSKTTIPVTGVTPPSEGKFFNGENTDKTLSGLVYGIKGLQTIGHAAQAFQKPDYIDPVLNPNASKIKSLAANRKIDLQSVLNEIRLDENKGIKDISDNSLSDSVRRSNIANTISNTQRAVADTKLKEQAMNMDFRKDEMVALDSLGQQDVAARVYSEDANAKTKANMQAQRSKFLQETVGGMGDYIAKKDYANKSDAFYTNLLNQKYEDFGVSDPKDFTKEHAEIIKYKLAKGESYDQIIKEYKTLTGDFKPKE